MAESQRVWILGAGFSRSLGAPLLPDLLSMRRWRDLRSKYPWLLDELANEEPHELLTAAVAVYLLYHWGRDFPEGSLFGQPPGHRGEKHFEHAEDFLVRLEHMADEQLKDSLQAALGAVYAEEDQGEAAVGSARSKVIRRYYDAELSWEFMRQVTKDQLLKVAKLLLALECEEFVKPDWADHEEFTPYKNWAERLNENDSIITFNYDRVVELALDGRQLVVTDRMGDQQGVRVHKLHGSTNWWLDGQYLKEQAEPCTDGRHVPLVAIPGRSKMADTAMLASLWEKARQKLAKADEVYIVGYGMPESDAKAREFILTALRENQKDDLSISIVLGEPGFRSARLEATLRQTLPRMDTGEKEAALRSPRNKFHLAVHAARLEATKSLSVAVFPQYAQDFLQGWALGYVSRTR